MRILFLIIVIGFTFVVLAEFSQFKRALTKIYDADKVELVVFDVLSTKIGKTQYLVGNPNDPDEQIEAIGLDYLYIHKIGSKVNAYKTADGIEIFHWNNTALAIVYILGILSIYVFLFSLFLDTPKFKGKILPMYQSRLFFLMFIFFATGVLLLSNYLYSEARIFEDVSEETIATLVGFEEKLCEKKNDDGEKQTYQCYARIYQYQSTDAKQYSHTTSFASSKNGVIGEEEQLFYLKSNPAFSKMISPYKMKLRALALAGFCIILLLGLRVAWRAKMHATIE